MKRCSLALFGAILVAACQDTGQITATRSHRASTIQGKRGIGVRRAQLLVGDRWSIPKLRCHHRRSGLLLGIQQ